MVVYQCAAMYVLCAACVVRDAHSPLVPPGTRGASNSFFPYHVESVGRLTACAMPVVISVLCDAQRDACGLCGLEHAGDRTSSVAILATRIDCGSA